MSIDDDGYGKSWSYRVFSSLNTEPDVPETGHRILAVHRVSWVRRPLGDYPIPDDVAAIDHDLASPSGTSIEEALLDAERILRAFDRPALIRAEWQEFFDWSQKSMQEQLAALSVKKDEETPAIDLRAHFHACIAADIPEEVGLYFTTTGLKGGNHSHGCETTLEIAWEGGNHVVEVDDAQGEGYPGRVTVTGLGDWELQGLVKALVRLGDELRPLVVQMKRKDQENMVASFVRAINDVSKKINE